MTLRELLSCGKIPFLELVCAGFFILVFLFSAAEAADNNQSSANCAKIVDDAARLRCYDELAGRKTKTPAAKDSVEAGEKTAAAKDEAATAGLSIMTRQWDLDRNNRKHTLILRPYRYNYFLPAAYNSSPNENLPLDVDPNSRAQYNEAKFQFSFKLKAWEDMFDKDVDLWIAYTQLSFWQLYNSAFSSPFRDTNYEPELLINFRTDYELSGWKGRFINVGLNHQSNGRSRPLSRSWNRVVANIGLEKDAFGILVRTWWRIPENEDIDDNPDIYKYLGYGELWGTYSWGRHRFAVMLRNNLRQGSNLGAVQLDWAFPLPFLEKEWVKGYIQYFNGYGESLLDYNQSVNRISAGIILTDWP